jgi:hypothetical protein
MLFHVVKLAFLLSRRILVFENIMLRKILNIRRVK